MIEPPPSGAWVTEIVGTGAALAGKAVNPIEDKTMTPAAARRRAAIGAGQGGASVETSFGWQAIRTMT
ncbi:hypothetical protein B857_03975 [Solibacillus isronensis B3W22]|uniref:Uncharacterized protein n=1 Tax=Solibacillus isronensis B3W22 TaxID=1224748 RepID=K1KTU1_9BACL|nr:hypothetical protein B857_03975 [Solibacillus isronensis B3W22]